MGFETISSAMLIGYARVSTSDQTLNLQKDALEKAGCDKIFTDTASGAKQERIGLDQAISYVRKGDTLVVWRLDRLGRSLPSTPAASASNRSLRQSTQLLPAASSSSTSSGPLRSSSATSSRCAHKQASAPPGHGDAKAAAPKLSTPKKSQAQRLYNARIKTVNQICRLLNISRATLYRYVKNS
jgi:DNA invertase Pin-like site-specific DNA recombinase